MVRLVQLAAWAGAIVTIGVLDALAATQDLIAYSRIGERLLVGLAGTVSLWMGYRLFRVMGEGQAVATGGGPVAESSVATAHGGGIEGNIGEFVRVKMWDVGPGLFFALFGSALLAYVMFSQVEIKMVPGEQKPTVTQEQRPAPQPTTTIRWNIPGLTPEQSSDKATIIVRAIRTLQDIKISGDASQDAGNRQATAIDNLVNSIPQLVDVGFGEGAYDTYTRLVVMQPAERERATQEDRRKFDAVNAAINGKI